MESLLFAVITAMCSFAGAWAAVRTELRQLRLDVNRAHRRLDAVGAPACSDR